MDIIESLKETSDELHDILPIISKLALNSLYRNEFVLWDMRTWILEHLLIFHQLLDGFTDTPNTKTINLSYEVDINDNWIARDFTMHDGQKLSTCPTYLTKVHPTMIPIEDYDTATFPKPITRACIYLQHKIHKVHANLLNNIYSRGISQNTPYYLDEAERHSFELLPSSFQHILKDWVCRIPINSSSISHKNMHNQYYIIGGIGLIIMGIVLYIKR